MIRNSPESWYYEVMKQSKPTSDKEQFPGIWMSRYIYRSSSEDADHENIHYMRIYSQGGEIVIESIAGANDSYLVARFWLDGDVATGSWQSVMSLTSEYQGAIYHGAAQLIIAPDRKSMAGKWVGFGKKMEVKTGPWEIKYFGEELPAGTKAAKQV